MKKSAVSKGSFLAGIAAIALCFLTVGAAGQTAEAGWVVLGVFEPKAIAVQPGTDKGIEGTGKSQTHYFQVKVGYPVTISCTWEKIDSYWIGTDTNLAKKLSMLNWKLPGEITLDGVKIKTFWVPVKISASDPPTKPGSESVQWVANQAGLHKGTCSVDPEGMIHPSLKKTIHFAIVVFEPAPPVPQAATQPKLPASKLPTVAGGPVTPTKPKGLPDITSGSGVTIGGKSVPWGSSVTVDVKNAHSVNTNNSGLCEFAIKHTARNIGLASTGSFDSVWKNSAVPGSTGRQWLPIEPGGAKEETDLVRLKPGQNLLHLELDNLKKVQEVNENNNKFQIVVNVTGSCGPKPGLVPPAGAPPQPGASAPSGQTSDPRALNPQPEVPSKPKKKSKPEREEKHLPAVQ